MKYRGLGFLAIVWLAPPPPHPPLPQASCLSISVFVWVACRAYWREREGVGEEPNYTTARKLVPLQFIQYSLIWPHHSVTTWSSNRPRIAFEFYKLAFHQAALMIPLSGPNVRIGAQIVIVLSQRLKGERRGMSQPHCHREGRGNIYPCFWCGGESYYL